MPPQTIDQKNQYDDNKVYVDPPLGKIIAETICKEISDSRIANKDIYDRAKSRENQYNQVTYWMESGKTCDEPWVGAADYFVPLTEWIVDAVWARVLSIIFGEEPWMTAHGVEGADVDKAEGVTDFCDMIFKEKVKLYENFKFYVKQMLKLPMAVIKYCWVREVDRVITKERALNFVSPDGRQSHQLLESGGQETMINALELEANGWQFAGSEDVWVVDEKELKDNPVLSYIPFEDYVWCQNAKKGHRVYWEGDRFYQTVNELQMGVMDGNFDSEVVEKLRKTIVTEGMSTADVAINVRGKLFECYNWYGRLPFNQQNQIDFQDPETIEQEVHCIISYKEKEMLSINKWEYSRYPNPDRVYIRGVFEETEQFCGRSLADKLYMSQKELNKLHNTIMNNAEIAMQKIFVKKRTLQGEEWEKPEIYPGAIWEEDMQGDIRVLEIGEVKAIAWELEQSFINFAERISNISVYQTGTARQGGNKTKGEVERTVYEGNIGMDKFIERCHGILKTICQWTIDYYHERMPPGLERRIRGEGADPIFPTQENMGIYQQQGINPYWSEDDIAGQFDFKWHGTSLNRSKEWKIQVSNDLFDRYIPHPMVAGSLIATWEILKKGLLARGITDWQKILPPKEAIIQEMQRMEIESRARQAEMEGEKQTPAKAVQLAEQKGVPRQEAVRILGEQGGKQSGT